MIKRTLYFENPAYLSLSNEQLLIKLPEVEKNDSLPDGFKKESVRTVPIEDIGVVLLGNRQITLTHALLSRLAQENVAVICCDDTHHPIGLMMPLESNALQSERFAHQLSASEPLKKQLWQQTIRAKISNQAQVLAQIRGTEVSVKNMRFWASEVTSGDLLNHEARAAAYYWSNLFGDYPDFIRRREEQYPNNLLNYGYAILRAAMSRALVASGLLPTLGIHHHSRYNAYCLADDIMEPYRPYVDRLVVSLLVESDSEELTKDRKVSLLQLLTQEVIIDGTRSPLQIALSKSSASLARCFRGESRKVLYPEIG